MEKKGREREREREKGLLVEARQTAEKRREVPLNSSIAFLVQSSSK